MPRAKRRKIISLTQTKKKGLEMKQNLVEEIRNSIDNYDHIYIFSAHHIRTNKLKDMRLEWGQSRFFLGKNKVMALALGRTPEEELHENLYKLSQKLVGQCGLLFTNAEKEEVLEYFETRKYPVSPNSGDIATETIELKAGLLEQFPHCMEPHLRKLGLPTRLQRGIPELLQDFTVCTEGKPLTANQANILRLLGKDMSLFYLQMEYHWSKEDGCFEKLLPSVTTPTKAGTKRKLADRDDMDEDEEDNDNDDDDDDDEEEEGDENEMNEEEEDDS
ncbi:mRNA turnover protein 4 homolog [Penaeus vannamei]|uniref:mRNA turnover protein 4 homolog n=1 Tax=Penaeus vannamei TaxID=6689 RepID=UPI00387F5857